MNKKTEIIFQVVNHQDGTRTPPGKGPIGEVISKIEESLDDGSGDHDYGSDLLLVVATDLDGGMATSDIPLVKLNRVQEFFAKLPE